jgi:CRISPR-associated exonuclease Cas4
LAFCERQWALIHLEGQWAENRLTAEGKVLHERVEGGERESRGDLLITRSVRLRSLRLGLVGVADVVEWYQSEAPSSEQPRAVRLSGREGWWRPCPVEYKRGRLKENRMDEVQLCAQALCLEETLGMHIEYGALFYGKPRRRAEVQFDESLRTDTEGLAMRMHELFEAEQTPTARYEPKCKNCSLQDRCLPKITGNGKVARYLDREVFHTDP